MGIVGVEDRYLQWRFDHEKQIEDFVGDLGQYERPRVFLENQFQGTKRRWNIGEGAKGNILLDQAGIADIAAQYISEAYKHVDS